MCHDGVFTTMNMWCTEELFFPIHDFEGTIWENREGYEKWDPARFAGEWATPELVSILSFPPHTRTPYLYHKHACRAIRWLTTFSSLYNRSSIVTWTTGCPSQRASRRSTSCSQGVSRAGC